MFELHLFLLISGLNANKVIFSRNDLLIERGALSVRAICTHAILSGDAYSKIESSKLEELIVTDSVPKIKPHSKIKVLSCADLFSDVMHKVHNNKSISSNFIM